MASKPDDSFEIYFAEKLWEMIPAIYRHEDGLAENPGVLRALVEILAEQAAILRRSHDRLWEDQFIELCNDWAIPYIADLVATRLVSALNKRGRRADVAKTIYYRRRKGTLRVLEELISDIAGWEGKVVENFCRLGRTRHGLDCRVADYEEKEGNRSHPTPLAGRFSGTLPGGWADLRRQRGSELTGGPFDEFHHTADVRQHRGVYGRYGIPKLAFHLYRLNSFKIQGVTPYQRADGVSFTFDPSGRDIQLFMPSNRPDDYDWDQWRSALEWELPAPIRCRLLGHAEYEITEALIQMLVNDHGLSQAAADELRIFSEVRRDSQSTNRGTRFRSENRLQNTFDTLVNSAELLDPGVYLPLIRSAIIDDCGKKALLPDAVQVIVAQPEGEVPREQIVAGNLSNWSASAPGKRLVIDAERGRFLFLDGGVGDVTVSYHYGFSGKIGAGTYDRRHVDETTPTSGVPPGGGPLLEPMISDDGITQINDSATYGPISDKSSIEKATLQAANQQRPYLRLASDWVLDTGTNTDAELTLDGLWIGGSGNYEIILQGDYERVTIRHTTLDPGGEDADGNPIPSVSLVVEAKVEEMVIDASITGQIRTQNNGIVEKLIVRDSILQSIDLDVDPSYPESGEVEMTRVTIFGPVEVHRLWASEALITDNTDVTDTQNGCFRFSAAPEGSRLPRFYESHYITDSNHYFTSRRFGHQGYGQLSETAPEEIRRGAENGSEIGAFSALINPIKLDSLGSKVDEYMPFGLIPIFIQET